MRAMVVLFVACGSTVPVAAPVEVARVEPDAALPDALPDALSRPPLDDAQLALAKDLYERRGCVACHTVDGTLHVGPSWKGIWGTQVTSSDLRTVTVDAAYVRESIQDPQAFVLNGFTPTMPTFEGLSSADVEALVGYIASLGD